MIICVHLRLKALTTERSRCQGSGAFFSRHSSQVTRHWCPGVRSQVPGARGYLCSRHTSHATRHCTSRARNLLPYPVPRVPCPGSSATRHMSLVTAFETGGCSAPQAARADGGSYKSGSHGQCTPDRGPFATAPRVVASPQPRVPNPESPAGPRFPIPTARRRRLILR